MGVDIHAVMKTRCCCVRVGRICIGIVIVAWILLEMTVMDWLLNNYPGPERTKLQYMTWLISFILTVANFFGVMLLAFMLHMEVQRRWLYVLVSIPPAMFLLFGLIWCFVPADAFGPPRDWDVPIVFPASFLICARWIALAGIKQIHFWTKTDEKIQESGKEYKSLIVENV